MYVQSPSFREDQQSKNDYDDLKDMNELEKLH